MEEQYTGQWTACGLDLACNIGWLDHWQTMITGLLAVVAAFIALGADTRRGKSERKRALEAARLRLHLAASDLIGFAREALSFLKHHLDHTNELAPPLPTLPLAALDALAAFVEATDDLTASAYVSNLVSRSQVLNSRLHSSSEDSALRHGSTAWSYVRNAAEVYAGAEGLLPYARGEQSSPPHSLDWTRVKSALFFADIYEDSYSDLHAFIDRAIARSARTQHD